MESIGDQVWRDRISSLSKEIDRALTEAPNQGSNAIMKVASRAEALTYELERLAIYYTERAQPDDKENQLKWGIVIIEKYKNALLAVLKGNYPDVDLGFLTRQVSKLEETLARLKYFTRI